MVTASSRNLALALTAAVALGLRLWYGCPGLFFERFHDERFTMANVAAVLESRRIAPANGYYPTLSYLPHTLVLAGIDAGERLVGTRWLALDPKRLGTPRVLLVCRVLQALLGAATALLAFAVGRRLFTERAGVLAAVAVAGMPWHIHISGVFKPDVVVSFTVLLAYLLALRLLERPTPARSALAGLGVALAASSKMTGALVAIPVGIAMVAILTRERRGLVLVGTAAMAAITSYLALNPDPRLYLFYLEVLRNEYGRKAGYLGSTPLDTLRQSLLLPLELFGRNHLLGLASLGGFAALALGCLRRSVPPRRRLGWAMLVVFPPLFALFYVLTTPLYKPNNFAPLFALCGLTLGYVLDRIGLLVARAGWAARAIVGGVMVALLLYPGWLYTRGSVMPTTLDAMNRVLDTLLQPPGGRTVLAEASLQQDSGYELRTRLGGGEIATRFLASLHAADPALLAAGDAEVFPRARLDGPDAAFYRDRIARADPQKVVRIVPGLFGAWGPPLVAIASPREVVPPVLMFPLRGGSHDRTWRYFGVLPESERHGLVLSLALWLPMRPLAAAPRATITVAGVPVVAVEAGQIGAGWLWVTERQEAPEGPISVVVETDVALSGLVAGAGYLWRK